jgi:hypothetical protein
MTAAKKTTTTEQKKANALKVSAKLATLLAKNNEAAAKEKAEGKVLSLKDKLKKKKAAEAPQEHQNLVTDKKDRVRFKSAGIEVLLVEGECVIRLDRGELDLTIPDRAEAVAYAGIIYQLIKKNVAKALDAAE